MDQNFELMSPEELKEYHALADRSPFGLSQKQAKRYKERVVLVKC